MPPHLSNWIMPEKSEILRIFVDKEYSRFHRRSAYNLRHRKKLDEVRSWEIRSYTSNWGCSRLDSDNCNHLYNVNHVNLPNWADSSIHTSTTSCNCIVSVNYHRGRTRRDVTYPQAPYHARQFHRICIVDDEVEIHGVWYESELKASSSLNSGMIFILVTLSYIRSDNHNQPT